MAVAGRLLESPVLETGAFWVEESRGGRPPTRSPVLETGAFSNVAWTPPPRRHVADRDRSDARRIIVTAACRLCRAPRRDSRRAVFSDPTRVCRLSPGWASESCSALHIRAIPVPPLNHRLRKYARPCAFAPGLDSEL